MISGRQRQFIIKYVRTTNNIRYSVLWRQSERQRKTRKEQT